MKSATCTKDSLRSSSNSREKNTFVSGVWNFGSSEAREKCGPHHSRSGSQRAEEMAVGTTRAQQMNSRARYAQVGAAMILALDDLPNAQVGAAMILAQDDLPKDDLPNAQVGAAMILAQDDLPNAKLSSLLRAQWRVRFSTRPVIRFSQTIWYFSELQYTSRNPFQSNHLVFQ